MSTKKMTKEEVDRITPADVHGVLADCGLQVDGYPIVYDLEKSSGVWIVDAITGKKYLDGFSFFATQALGHNHPALTQDAEFLKRLTLVAQHNPPNADAYTVPMAQFLATFKRVLMPDCFKHIFLISGGSPAVSNAIKTATDWKIRKNLAAGRGEKGYRILYFNSAFHGRTGLALSCTNSTLHKYQYFPRFADWVCVHGPKCTSVEMTPEEAKADEERALRHVRNAIIEADHSIAAMIIEPIQGEGGDVHWRGSFLAGLRQIANELEVMLIYDEVQTGAGTTGKRWAFEHWGDTCIPDLIAFGKKTQVCGVISTSRVDEIPHNVFTVSGRLDSTWTGNLTDMVRGRKILEVIEEQNLIENARVVGDYFVEQLKLVSKDYPQVTRARGRGCFIGATLPSVADRSRVVKAAFDNGLIFLICGATGIRFRPALIFTNSDVDTLITILRKSLHDVYGDVRHAATTQ